MNEPIAIIGLACRFPKAPSPEAYWKLLVDGVEAVGEPPRGRTELEPPAWLLAQAPNCRRGGFLDEVDRFEPGFFRISLREAARMDPQQRLLLELAWEALEDAGQPVAQLAGTSTGVFVGVMNADFQRRASRDLTELDAQLGAGSSLGIAPNRVSFVLDLRGPSMAIDTLCSSSLVAVHQACQSLLADESSPIAIAGGVNVILDRTMDVFYARAGLLSKEGRCRAFDAGAGGIVRGEGIGLLVLKRLARALADGDRVRAVIRGSAINQDGRSNGLTSPSRWAQEAVLRTAYDRAGVTPNSVPYVEAHGTGTLIGDPIEAAALGTVLGEGRTSSCAIGSVKTNLGHLESAAGIASLVKTVLSLEQRTIVPSLHFAQANPYMHFEERKLHVPTRAGPWVGDRVAGVSSFGMGGTNAHVVLAAAPEVAPVVRGTRHDVRIPISARSIAALDVLEARTRAQLATFDATDIAYTFAARRDQHDHRRVLVVAGANISVEPAHAVEPVAGTFVRLGTYPWQREVCSAELPLEPVEALVPRWERAAAPPEARTRGDWCVHGSTSLVAALERSGQRCVDEARATNIVLFAELGSAVRCVQALAARSDVRLWLVTRGACVVGEAGPLASLANATVWGLGRVAMNELPRLRCTLLDLSAVENEDETAMLVRELLADGDEREVAIRGTSRHVARVDTHTVSSPRLRLRGDATYLVAGGLGGLGIAAARRLVERGARSVVLLSRRGIATDEASRVIAALRASSAQIVVERADVADREALAEIVKQYPIRGVIHAAGVMTPAMITAIDPAELGAALAAKVDGARHLHELTASLDFFVLFSSIATLLGMPGQGAYAAANAYLDALAAHRRAHGLPATSIAWTVIEGTGMAASAGERALGQLRDRGVTPMSVARATDVLEQLATAAPAHAGAVTFDARKWAGFYPHATARFALVPAPDVKPRTRSLEDDLVTAFAKVLNTSPDLDRSLADLGVDSLIVLELQEMLKAELGIEVTSDRLLGNVSIRTLAAELASDRRPVATISLRDDARLDPALAFTCRAPTPARSILVTGATGFLGAFVLAELLLHTDAHVHCLVRGRDAMRRLEATLGRYDLPALDLATRVTCIPGDLTKPRLGIETDYERLAIDTIVHSGASVNFVYPYDALRADNVGGTFEVLRMAAATGARLHHVSTIGVFPGGPDRRDAVVESARSTEPERLALGYMRAKWVAEELVSQAESRGLDVSIYRPGTIAGHSQSGAFNPDDFVCALIKGCVQLGIAPRVDAPIHLAPVDYVSRALVQIALGPSSGTYHLVGRHPVAWGEVVDWLRRIGYALVELPYAEWRASLVERAVATGNALAPLLPLFVEHDDTDWLYLPTYDDARTQAALRGSGVTCPPVDAALVRRYVERFVVSGYLRRP